MTIPKLSGIKPGIEMFSMTSPVNRGRAGLTSVWRVRKSSPESAKVSKVNDDSDYLIGYLATHLPL